MSTISDIGDQPIEHDPTGVRALLGALPDPGPMPAELVARIDAALAAEADGGDRLARVIPLAAADATRDDGILSGQARQQRRRAVLPWLAAAAVAGIVTVAGTNLLHDHGSSIAAAFQGGSTASSARSAAASAAASVENGPADVAGAGPGTVTVMRTGASYLRCRPGGPGRRPAAGPQQDRAAVGRREPRRRRDRHPGRGTAHGAVRHGVDPAAPLTVDLASSRRDAGDRRRRRPGSRAHGIRLLDGLYRPRRPGQRPLTCPRPRGGRPPEQSGPRIGSTQTPPHLAVGDPLDHKGQCQ